MNNENKGRRKKVLVFHPAIAPYRIDFFNRIYDNFETHICFYDKYIADNRFDIEKLEEKLHFEPDYFDTKDNHKNIISEHAERIKKYNPDVVLVSEFSENVWAVILLKTLFRMKFRIVTICDDTVDIAENCRNVRKISRNLGLRIIDGIILCNDNTLKWYKDRFPRIDACFFPIIQDEVLYRKNAENYLTEINKIINEYKLHNKRLYLFVGRLAPQKNIEYLIRSFIKQHKKYIDNILLLIGGDSNQDPGFRERMQNFINENNANDYIRFLGRKEGEELKIWFFLGQIFILPSVWEPFGAVVNEALISGEYVMVSDRAGSSCLINENNGERIDITKESIEFDRSISMVKPICEKQSIRDCKMPYTFNSKIKAFLTWIDNI